MEMIDLFLFDKEKNVIGILPQNDLISYVQQQELNGTINAEVEGVYSEIIEKAVYFGSKDVEQENIFWRYKIISADVNSSDRTFSFKGIFELFDDLKNRTVIKDKRPQNLSANNALNALLQGTTWQVGNVNSRNISSSNWYYKSSIEAFWDFLKKWRVEFKPRMIFSNGKVVAKYIDIANQISDNYGKWYEYGDKLLNITAEADTSNLATAFYIRGKGEEHTNEDGEVTGYGRRITIADVEWSKSKGDPENKPKGQEYIVLEEATKLYGFEDGTPRFDVIILEDIEDKQELIKAGYQEALRLSRPQRQFKATITEDEFAELGEISTIIDTRLNIRYQTRTFKIKRDFLNKKIKEIEFGDRLVKSRTETITDIADKKVQENSAKIDNKINNLRTELIGKQEEVAKSKLQEIRDDLISKYWSTTAYTYNLQPDNEYKLPAGIYSFTAPIDKNPSRAIYLGGGLLMISNSKRSDGQWDWTTVADGAGVNANAINAGTIDASKINVVNLRAESINSGVLQGDNSYYDLRNGTIKTTQSGRSNVMRHGQYFIMRGSDEILNISNYVGDGRDAYIIEGSGADSLRLGKSNRQGDYSRDYLTFNDRQNRAVLHTDFYRIVNGYNVPVPYNLAGQTTVDNIPAGGSSYVDITYGFNFSSLPVVVVSVNNGSPELFPVGTSAISRSGFRIHVKNNWNRSNSITVNWIAMEMR